MPGDHDEQRGVGGLDGAAAPDVLAVRDAWVSNLNAVDWPDM
jgi:hypothetical protein